MIASGCGGFGRVLSVCVALKRVGISIVAGAVFGMTTGHVHAAGGSKEGADAFATECAECHSLKEGKNKKGPSLFAVSGRKAGSIEDFKYSSAMKASNIVWTADQLDSYLTLPKKAVPGGIMKYDGLPDAKARAEVIEYLSTIK